MRHLIPMWIWITVPAILLMSLLAVSAFAATYYVNSAGTGDYATIQAAIDACVDGDEIELADGTYLGPGNRDIDYLGKAITVYSQSDDPLACVIDCQGGESESHRGFNFHGDEGEDSVLRGVTVTGGYLSGYGMGGGIFCEVPSAPTINNCRIVDNYATNGGGLAVIGQNDDGPSVIDCEISSNSAGYATSGGGIYCDVAGGIYENCLIADNTGTGIYFIDVFGWPTVTGCEIKGNTGNGITINEGSPSINHTIILDNALDGIYCWDSSAQVTRCTIVGNRKGLDINRSSLEIDLTIIAFNTAEAVFCNEDGEAMLGCCDVYENLGGDWTGCLAGQQDGPGNFSGDPCFCDLDSGDVSVCADSYCLPQNNPFCADIVGALGEGCAACDCPPPVAAERLLWSDLKAMYR